MKKIFIIIVVVDTKVIITIFVKYLFDYKVSTKMSYYILVANY